MGKWNFNCEIIPFINRSSIFIPFLLSSSSRIECNSRFLFGLSSLTSYRFNGSTYFYLSVSVTEEENTKRKSNSENGNGDAYREWSNKKCTQFTSVCVVITSYKIDRAKEGQKKNPIEHDRKILTKNVIKIIHHSQFNISFLLAVDVAIAAIVNADNKYG